MFTRRAAIAASAGLALAGSARAAGPVAPSLDEFLKKPALRGAALSPDGKRIAVVGETWEGGKRNAYIEVIQTDDPNLARSHVPVGDHDVEAVSWANDERLLLRTARKISDFERKHANWSGDIERGRIRRLLSITAEGRDPKVMFADELPLHLTNTNLATIADMLPEDPQHVLMLAMLAARVNLYRVNVNTGAAELVERGGPQTNGWEFQNGRAVLRWDFLSTGGYGSILSRPEGETDWKVVRKIHQSELFKPDFSILGDFGEPGVFLVATRGGDDAMATIRKWDVRTGALGDIVAQRPNLDVDDALFDQDGKFAAAQFIDDRVVYDFAVKKLAPHYRGIDGFFSRECNVSISNLSRNHNRCLMHVSGPRLPGAYYYYDLETRHLENLGLMRPWLTEDRLAKVELLDVRLRDGGAMRAYLTVPLASGPRPLVVLPHEGPEKRDSLSYHLFAQVFAAQGWLVLQPNFRGSSGYGREFADAGRRRWGDRMQEDVEDAVAYVLASGRADPARVAIWGRGYGGYAALMGAVRNPNLYRCAVSVAGLSDLPRALYDTRRGGRADDPYYLHWARTLGDPKTDAAMLERASPARRASEIKSPVLIIQGLDDNFVGPIQSQLMANALKAARRPHDHIELRGMGHSDWEDEDERFVLKTSIDFIAKGFA
ncbi:alpha/beta hydrolase family protein [Phenylobacterium sp.]|uniref:alpha/beta hydrolase family protein n=1 Tax=Phenylobacterium sp. TaxID=1871053 RepID=UPI002FC8C71C